MIKIKIKRASSLNESKDIERLRRLAAMGDEAALQELQRQEVRVGSQPSPEAQFRIDCAQRALEYAQRLQELTGHSLVKKSIDLVERYINMISSGIDTTALAERADDLSIDADRDSMDNRYDRVTRLSLRGIVRLLDLPQIQEEKYFRDSAAQIAYFVIRAHGEANGMGYEAERAAREAKNNEEHWQQARIEELGL